MQRAAFFDIGDTLGSVRIAGDGIAIDAFPGVVPALRALHDDGVRLGILSHRGSIPAAAVRSALDLIGVLALLDPDLIVFGRKDSATIFGQAADLVAAPRTVTFVGENAAERAFAREAGLGTCTSPLLTPHLLLGQGTAPRYVRITVPASMSPGPQPDSWRTVLRELLTVPLLDGPVADPPIVYAITDDAGAAQLDGHGFWVDRLGAAGEPDASELVLLSSAPAGDAPHEVPAGRVLASTAEGRYVAVPFD